MIGRSADVRQNCQRFRTSSCPGDDQYARNTPLVELPEGSESEEAGSRVSSARNDSLGARKIVRGREMCARTCQPAIASSHRCAMSQTSSMDSWCEVNMKKTAQEIERYCEEEEEDQETEDSSEKTEEEDDEETEEDNEEDEEEDQDTEKEEEEDEEEDQDTEVDDSVLGGSKEKRKGGVASKREDKKGEREEPSHRIDRTETTKPKTVESGHKANQPVDKRTDLVGVEHWPLAISPSLIASEDKGDDGDMKELTTEEYSGPQSTDEDSAGVRNRAAPDESQEPDKQPDALLKIPSHGHRSRDPDAAGHGRPYEEAALEDPTERQRPIDDQRDMDEGSSKPQAARRSVTWGQDPISPRSEDGRGGKTEGREAESGGRHGEKVHGQERGAAGAKRAAVHWKEKTKAPSDATESDPDGPQTPSSSLRPQIGIVPVVVTQGLLGMESKMESPQEDSDGEQGQLSPVARSGTENGAASSSNSSERIRSESEENGQETDEGLLVSGGESEGQTEDERTEGGEEEASPGSSSVARGRTRDDDEETAAGRRDDEAERRDEETVSGRRDEELAAGRTDDDANDGRFDQTMASLMESQPTSEEELGSGSNAPEKKKRMSMEPNTNKNAVESLIEAKRKQENVRIADDDFDPPEFFDADNSDQSAKNIKELGSVLSAGTTPTLLQKLKTGLSSPDESQEEISPDKVEKTGGDAQKGAGKKWKGAAKTPHQNTNASNAATKGGLLRHSVRISVEIATKKAVKSKKLAEEKSKEKTSKDDGEKLPKVGHFENQSGELNASKYVPKESNFDVQERKTTGPLATNVPDSIHLPATAGTGKKSKSENLKPKIQISFVQRNKKLDSENRVKPSESKRAPKRDGVEKANKTPDVHDSHERVRTKALDVHELGEPKIPPTTAATTKVGKQKNGSIEGHSTQNETEKAQKISTMTLTDSSTQTEPCQCFCRELCSAARLGPSQDRVTESIYASKSSHSVSGSVRSKPSPTKGRPSYLRRTDKSSSSSTRLAKSQSKEFDATKRSPVPQKQDSNTAYPVDLTLTESYVHSSSRGNYSLYSLRRNSSKFDTSSCISSRSRGSVNTESDYHNNSGPKFRRQCGEGKTYAEQFRERRKLTISGCQRSNSSLAK